MSSPNLPYMATWFCASKLAGAKLSSLCKITGSKSWSHVTTNPSPRSHVTTNPTPRSHLPPIPLPTTGMPSCHPFPPPLSSSTNLSDLALLIWCGLLCQSSHLSSWCKHALWYVCSTQESMQGALASSNYNLDLAINWHFLPIWIIGLPWLALLILTRSRFTRFQTQDSLSLTWRWEGLNLEPSAYKAHDLTKHSK